MIIIIKKHDDKKYEPLIFFLRAPYRCHNLWTTFLAMFNNSNNSQNNNSNDDILFYGYNSTRTLMGCFLVMTGHY